MLKIGKRLAGPRLIRGLIVDQVNPVASDSKDSVRLNRGGGVSHGVSHDYRHSGSREESCCVENLKTHISVWPCVFVELRKKTFSPRHFISAIFKKGLKSCKITLDYS